MQSAKLLKCNFVFVLIVFVFLIRSPATAKRARSIPSYALRTQHSYRPCADTSLAAAENLKT
jgi:hypothetical protein